MDMSKKRVTKGAPKLKIARKKRNFVFKLIACVFMLYTLVTLVQYRIAILDKEKQKDLLTNEITAQSDEKERLNSLLENINQESYMEKIAREKLGYVSSGEKVFVPINGN